MKKRSHLKFILWIGCLFLNITILYAQAPASPQANNTVSFPASSATANKILTYQIIHALNNTFCYDVFADGRLMIHQTSIPGLPGNEGFKTKDDAIKVAEMVVYKIRNGEMPPTVSIDEMESLHFNK